MLASALSVVLTGKPQVKKGIVVLLIVVALLVLLSPGLIGRMAEKSIDENLNWAADQSGGVVVTSEKFQRGWFSSQGQHRVRIDDDELKALLREAGFHRVRRRRTQVPLITSVVVPGADTP